MWYSLTSTYVARIEARHPSAGVMKLANMHDSKSCAARLVGSSPTSGTTATRQKQALSYLIGAALGDGNLSNPNGRAVRLRITCDEKYPNIARRVTEAMHLVMPRNRVTTVPRKDGCFDISCYSNQWEEILGWRATRGPKASQQARIPEWIKKEELLMASCVRGLFETDGSVYVDRGYRMVNFVSYYQELAEDTFHLVEAIGFAPKIYRICWKKEPPSYRYNIRLSRNVDTFLGITGIAKD